ncbi:MAG: hypothetical protein L3J28_12665 [Candidatus Polarisedimenticolaceae bacterium]|nr:hypothetical protein [Candidatus Polarisedimenticolaceae bacterium]
MKTLSVALIILLALVGCQTSPTKESSSNKEKKSEKNSVQPSKYGFQFEPGTNEEFRLRALSPQQQKIGYSQLCVDTKSFNCPPLPYAKYHGMKGYFLSMEPATVDFSGYEFRRVVLQNGQRFFYVSNENYGGIYGKRNPIQKISSLKSLIGRPIAPKSTITISDIVEMEGEDYVKLSNGVQIDKEQFTSFTKIIATITNQKRLNELTHLLAELELVHDAAKDRLVIHHPGGKNHPLQAFIIDKHGKLSLLIRHQYTAKKRLYARSFSLMADQAEYRSTRLPFKNKEMGTMKREWYDINPKADYLKVLGVAAEAKKVTIRFFSDGYFIDKELSFSNKVQLKQIIRSYQLLRKQ